MRRAPFVEHLARLLDDLALALDVVDVALEADVAQPLASVVERQALALGERGGHRLDAVVQHAVEDAVRADRDRKVREPADVAVDGRERVGVRHAAPCRSMPSAAATARPAPSAVGS